MAYKQFLCNAWSSRIRSESQAKGALSTLLIVAMCQNLSDTSSDVNYQLAELLRVEDLQGILKGVQHYVYDSVKDLYAIGSRTWP